MSAPITDDELASFIAWLSKAMHRHHQQYGMKLSTVKRHEELLEELRIRSYAKKYEQMEMFP